MIIKTITCHKVNNHGANLQAYALMHYLEGLGNDVEIIDYCPEYFDYFRPFLCSTEKYQKSPILKFAYIIAKFPGRLRRYNNYLKSERKANFEAFRSKYYHLTKKYRSFEELKNNPPQADLYIAGSDQIWNTMMNNGKDPSFYLQFAPENTKTATYAASFSVSEIPEEMKTQVAERIKNIDNVSVREASALNILKDLGIDNASVVLDPVFLLNNEEWTSLADTNTYQDSYVLVYDFENADLVKNFALKYAKENNRKIYSLYSNAYADKCFENVGPEGFLSLIQNADFVISNSFHATAFSLIFEKNFAVIKRKEGINSRMVDLLSSVKLENHIVDSYEHINQIDYSSVKPLLDRQIESSKRFIDTILS